MAAFNPTAKVPVLEDHGLLIWDILAICEYLAECFPEKLLWPSERPPRTRARSICSEMYSGFAAQRSTFPMNIEATLPLVGALALQDKPAVRQDLERLQTMWEDLLKVHGRPMLFGQFSIADAYFAPVCMHMKTYVLPLHQVVSDYVDRVYALEGVQAWVQAAKAEKNFLDFKELYQLGRD